MYQTEYNTLRGNMINLPQSKRGSQDPFRNCPCLKGKYMEFVFLSTPPHRSQAFVLAYDACDPITYKLWKVLPVLRRSLSLRVKLPHGIS